MCLRDKGSLALLPEGTENTHKDREPEKREPGGIALEELDLKYLQYALAVVRYGSVTQAARALYLAQPNLSRAIGELEQSLGFPLFLRTRQGMSLTPQGGSGS